MSATEPQRPIRVLIVDDSRVIRRVVQSELSKRGWEVRAAGGGAEALTIVPEFGPDVVVCDLNMPEMDGVEVVARLSRLDSNLPIVMHSDEAELTRVLNTVHEGAFDFIPKSNNLTALAAAVERAAKHGAVVRDNFRLTADLRTLNGTLERRVEQRTAELASVNDELNNSIRELKRMQEQLVSSEKFAALGQLAAGVAHEINTPLQFVGDSSVFLKEAFGGLAGVMASVRSRHPDLESAFPELAADLQRLQQELDVDYFLENAPGAFDRLQDGLARVTRIVQAMKEFAHPGSGDHKPVDVNEIVRRALIIAGNQVKHVADVALRLGTLPPVAGDEGELNQVFLNILVNAAHAVGDRIRGTDRQGHIDVSTRVEDGGAAVCVAISDDGGGIPAAIRQRIFEPFFTTKEVGRGSGMGLALARSVVVDKHGGKLNLETEEGVGTTFFITLPVCPAGNAPVPGESAPDGE